MSNQIRETEDVQHLHLADVEDVLIHHTELPRTALSDFLDTIIDRIGTLASWLWIATVGFILYSVISRYAFASGSVMLEEIQWHLAGAAWLVGLSYTLVHDAHVRVDVIHERLTIRTQGWIEFFGLLLLLLPFLLISLDESFSYALSSFEQNERSQAPAGLPYRWLIKAFLPFSMLLMIIAASSRLLKVTSLLFGFPRMKKSAEASPTHDTSAQD